jgi:hypothetical protein
MSHEYLQPGPRSRLRIGRRRPGGSRSTDGTTDTRPAPATALPSEHRSAEYLNSVRELDSEPALDATADPSLHSNAVAAVRLVPGRGMQTATEALLAAAASIRAEFDRRPAEPPPTLIARCWLDDRFDVHTLGQDGQLLEHHARDEALPPELERARAAVLSGDYAAVEIYHDRLVLVRGDGTTTGKE